MVLHLGGLSKLHVGCVILIICSPWRIFIIQIQQSKNPHELSNHSFTARQSQTPFFSYPSDILCKTIQYHIHSKKVVFNIKHLVSVQISKLFYNFIYGRVGDVFIFTVCCNQDLNVGHLYLVDTSFKSHIKVCTLFPQSLFSLKCVF